MNELEKKMMYLDMYTMMINELEGLYLRKDSLYMKKDAIGSIHYGGTKGNQYQHKASFEYVLEELEKTDQLIVEKREELEVTRQALLLLFRSLKIARRQEVALMRYIDQQSYEKIANALSLSRKSVWRMHKAALDVISLDQLETIFEHKIDIY